MAFTADFLTRFNYSESNQSGRLKTNFWVMLGFTILPLLFSVICVVISAVPFGAKSLLFALILGTLFFNLFAWRSKWDRLTKITQSSLWELHDHQKQTYLVKLNASKSYVSAYFIFLNGFFLFPQRKFFRKTFSLLLCRWSYTEKEWREWQLALRINKNDAL